MEKSTRKNQPEPLDRPDSTPRKAFDDWEAKYRSFNTVPGRILFWVERTASGWQAGSWVVDLFGLRLEAPVKGRAKFVMVALF